MTDIRNSGISTIIEIRFFYCWIQLPAVVVWLVFWLAISPIGGQSRCRKRSGSCALETQPLHEVFRQAVSDSQLCPLCGLQSSRLSIFPLSPATSVFSRIAPTTSRISSESLENVTMNDLIKDHCILFTALGALTCSLAISPSISADATARIQIFWRRHGHEPMEISRHVPVLDALGKQTNRDIHHCAADDAPEMCHIRLLSAGLHSACTAWVTCCRRVTSLESWVGENTLALFSTSRNMLNGQLWLEKTDFFNCVNCQYPNFSHWYINYIVLCTCIKALYIIYICMYVHVLLV